MFGFFNRKDKNPENKFSYGLERSRGRFKEGLLSLFGKNIKIDAAFLEQVESFLYQSDLGADVSEQLIDAIQKASRSENLSSYEDIARIIESEFETVFENDDITVDIDRAKPFVIMVIGVNGAGKTTTIGKLAYLYKTAGKKVTIVAGDTYRAAAVDQLERWAERAGVEIVKNAEAKNPSGIVYDGIQTGLNNGSDVIIVDTAGRLHTKYNLMDELSKLDRIVKKLIPEAPHETLLVLDGTVGQNGLIQAREFQKAAPVTGLVITKLDGTAKGGIVIGVKSKLNIPVKFVGLGEQLEDLIPFDPHSYVRALFRTEGSDS